MKSGQFLLLRGFALTLSAAPITYVGFFAILDIFLDVFLYETLFNLRVFVLVPHIIKGGFLLKFLLPNRLLLYFQLFVQNVFAGLVLVTRIILCM